MSNIDKNVLHTQQLKSFITGFLSDPAHDSQSSRSMTAEVFRIALASLEAEAVCVIDQSNLDYLKSGSDADVWPASRTEMGDVLLYRTAPPAPVALPSGYSDFEEIWSSSTHPLTQDDEMKDFAWDIWNACRATMLKSFGNSEQLNSPVIPDGWVACSERMPEGSEEVLCTKEFDGPGDWRKKVGYWLAGKWTVYGASWTPTHWMPLPAAPHQEVKP